VPVGIGEFTLLPSSPGVPAYDTFPDGRFLLVKTESDNRPAPWSSSSLDFVAVAEVKRKEIRVIRVPWRSA